MPDKKPTDNEIKKALECCSSNIVFENCAYCSYKEDWSKGITCIKKSAKNALDLINRLQAENSNLTSNLTSLQNDLTSAKAENEQLTKDKESLAYSLANAVGQKMTAKAEAYKEFADRLCEDRVANDPVVISAKCLLKELTNEQPPNDVKCIDCEHLEINGAWGVCAEKYKMVHPDDCCGKGKLKGDDNER